MGNSDEGKATKGEQKSTSTPVENGNVHVYPDWAAMQAYYAPGVALQPYYNSAVAPGHPPPPYMWGPQHMMPPYGTPYAAIYPHGGVYAHPAIPIASTPLKPSANTDRGLMKKLKGFDGLAMSIGNDNADKAEGEAQNGLSQSLDSEGSSDGSDGNTSEADQKKRKRSPEGTPTAEVGNAKPDVKASSPVSGHLSASIKKVLGVPVTLANANGSLPGTSVHAAMGTALELKHPGVDVKGNQVVDAPTGLMSSEAWLQNERELKRERRKQSNRESARRSRLRKQAETEQLARKVESLSAENLSLKSEINQLTESSEKLRSENSLLMDKLRSTELGLPEGVTFNSIDAGYRVGTISTENLLSKVDGSGSFKEITEKGIEAYERGSKSGAKFHHQLLDSNPRADAVAAG